MVRKNMYSTARRIISNIACLVMLSAGSLFTIFFFGNVKLSDDFMVGTRYVTMFAVILMSLIVCVEAASLATNINATRNTLNAAIFILGFITSSRDMINLLDWAFHIEWDSWIAIVFFDIPHSITFFAASYWILKFYCNNYQIDISNVKKIGAILLISLATIDLILIGFKLQFISSLIIVHIALFIYFVFFFMAHRKRRVNNVFVLSGLIFLGLAGSYVASSSGTMFSNYPYGLESWAMIVVFALFLMIYADYLIRGFRKSYAEKEYQEKVQQLQTIILKEQINPHFIFNTLNLIKGIYQKDRARGDRAIDMLGRHIRANVDVKGGKLLIPLTEEIKNIECFVELANMQNDEPINILYNIDSFDFDVPILSIEPFIENAIKYSCIQSKEDGYIELSTEEDDDYYIIMIKDNGKGFDTKEHVQQDSHGIRNALQRFEFLQKAKTRVKSKVGKGTSIEIYIPKAGN